MSDNILFKKPISEDVYKLVSSRKSQWKEIGTELWVYGCRPLPDRTLIDKNEYLKRKLSELVNLKTSSDDDKNLDEMLDKWIHSNYSDVSWNHLIEVLLKLEMHDVVKKIKEFLNSEETIKKYESEEVLTEPTVKTLYEFLLNGKKTDYSRILRQSENIYQRSADNLEYKESELEFLVLVKFHGTYSQKLEWRDLVNELDYYYDIIGEIVKFLRSKGKDGTKILSGFMRADFEVVTEDNAIKVLQSKQNKWFTIGKKLDVDVKYRRQLQNDELSDEEKLRAVLKKFLDKLQSPIYWGDFKDKIKDLFDNIYSIDDLLRGEEIKENRPFLQPFLKRPDPILPIVSQVQKKAAPHPTTTIQSKDSQDGDPYKYTEKIYARMQDSKFNRSQGIIFILGMNGPQGTEVDVENVDKTFQELKFATYIVRDPTADEVTTLIKAAASIKYPIKYRYVALYFAGHGGMDEDERSFINCLTGDKVFTEESIIGPLKCLHEKSLTRLFFFDCCQSISYRCPPNKRKGNPGELIAYACNKDEKTTGDNEIGGIWTHHLCKNFRELDEPITTILSHTYDDVVTAKKGFQNPVVISAIGMRKLKQDAPIIQPATTNNNDPSTDNTDRSQFRSASDSGISKANSNGNSAHEGVLELSPSNVVRHLTLVPSMRWSDFALELDIGRAERDSLAMDKILTDEKKMERVIEIWCKTKPCTVSWMKLVSVAKELNLTDTAIRLENASKVKLMKIEDWKTVYRILRGRAAPYWEDMAIYLELDDQLIDDMRKNQNVYLTLERVIRRWIDGQTCEVSWTKIIRVTWELGFYEETVKLMEQHKMELDKINAAAMKNSS